jgi:MtN3 and saliva related transmembrane protein
MEPNDWVGMAAGALTTVSLVPQVVKTWRTRSTKDISLGMFLLFTFGVILWLIYGTMIRSMPVIVANSVTLILSLTILLMKRLYK